MGRREGRKDGLDRDRSAGRARKNTGTGEEVERRAVSKEWCENDGVWNVRCCVNGLR